VKEGKKSGEPQLIQRSRHAVFKLLCALGVALFDLMSTIAASFACLCKQFT